MRILLISDIHGNLEALEKCLHEAEKQNIDCIRVLGDIVGYMANPNECIEKVKGFDCVSGNHDNAVSDDNELLCFNPYAREALLWTRKQLNQENIEFLRSLLVYKTYSSEGYTIAHGSLIDPKMYIEYESQAFFNSKVCPTNILFVGHTHIPAIWSIFEKKDILGHEKTRTREMAVDYKEPVKLKRYRKYVINVGSVGQPRDGDPRGCCLIYDTEAYTIHYLRFEYPVHRTIEKIKKNGLPEFLYERLLYGG